MIKCIPLKILRTGISGLPHHATRDEPHGHHWLLTCWTPKVSLYGISRHFIAFQLTHTAIKWNKVAGLLEVVGLVALYEYIRACTACCSLNWEPLPSLLNHQLCWIPAASWWLGWLVYRYSGSWFLHVHMVCWWRGWLTGLANCRRSGARSVSRGAEIMCSLLVYHLG